MPTTIPTEQEMLNLASEKKGIPVNELKKNIDEFASKYSSFLPKRLLTYRYMVDVLGIQPELSVIAPKGVITIADMKKSLAKTGIHTQGYIIRNELSKTAKGDPIWRINIMDNTDFISGNVFFEKIREAWEGQNIPSGSFLDIENCGVEEYKERKVIRFTESTKFTIVKEPPYKIDDISVPINALKENDFAFIRCMIVVVEDNPPYIGCPYCLKKLPDVEEGQEAECPNEKCSHAGEDIVAEELQFIRCFCSDGNDDIRVSFDPRLLKKYGMSSFVEGRWLELTGNISSSGEFRVNSVTFKDLFKDSDKEVAKRIIVPVEMTVEAAADKISFMLASYDKMEEAELLQNAIDLLDINEEKAKEALKTAMDRNLVKKEGKFYVRSKD